MAPLPPIGADEVIAAIQAPAVELPYCFGAPTLQFAVCREGPTWRLRRLVLDPALVQERMRSGKPLLPGQGGEVMSPGPQILLEAASLDGFCAALRACRPWPPA